MHVFLLAIHVLLALALIGLVLIQHGRGADAGAAFGSGASATVFGARGSASFLTKLTTGLAFAFFANSLALAYLSAHQSEQPSLVERAYQQEAAAAPAEPAADAEAPVAPADGEAPPAPAATAPSAEGEPEGAAPVEPSS
ncbi:MAG: hypothetical protein KatS3mg121_1089 [Gammaproteobacteria bacterium]|nr:MAG: hypothetical protein KatS3mg121_1089 [Gammaproteobacteria bacterium]